MCKEYLKALGFIKSLLKDDWVDSVWKPYYETIKQGLQHLEAIENANPSEALECLENWYNTQSPKTKMYEYELHYRIIKQALIKAQEQEKILKEKKVELMSLYLSSSAEEYNNQFVRDENKLTQNEFELLKRWLG